MEMSTRRAWMYNRLLPGRKAYTTEFLNGLVEFVAFARQHQSYLSEGKIRCPCKMCKNEVFLTLDEVYVHILKKGFTPSYWYWTSHGERIPNTNTAVDMNSVSCSNQDWCCEDLGRHQDMVFDAVGLNREQHFAQNEEEPPNMEAAKFYSMLNSAQQPLWPGCETASVLPAAVKMLSLKSKHMSQACFNDVMKFMKESSHPENVIPSNFREAQKLVARLDLSKMKIDCCIDGCMLYYKGNSTLKKYKFCYKPRYKEDRACKRNATNVPYKRTHYSPLIPRLQRLYASMRFAKHHIGKKSARNFHAVNLGSRKKLSTSFYLRIFSAGNSAANWFPADFYVNSAGESAGK